MAIGINVFIFENRKKLKSLHPIVCRLWLASYAEEAKLLHHWAHDGSARGRTCDSDHIPVARLCTHARTLNNWAHFWVMKKRTVAEADYVEYFSKHNSKLKIVIIWACFLCT